jgi:3-hydroxyacyl-CoA dehydrogenase/3-hydroxy-2-methylbutyryl-CoA dehydrogenase
MKVRGARALITGGGSGLGEGTARRLAAAGAKVALLDLPDSRGAFVAGDLGSEHHFVAADVTDREQVKEAVEGASQALGGIDICVNAAGVANAARVVNRSGDLFPLDLFRFVLDVNLIGTFDVTRRAARIMSLNKPNDDGEKGVVINVASIAAFEGQIGQAAYSASKGGVAAMTLPLARDLASVGVRVNCIAPGIMDTPMIAGMPDAVRESLVEVHVFPKRLGKPADFAALAQHMVENALLNGEVVRLDAAARMGPR